MINNINSISNLDETKKWVGSLIIDKYIPLLSISVFDDEITWSDVKDDLNSYYSQIRDDIENYLNDSINDSIFIDLLSSAARYWNIYKNSTQVNSIIDILMKKDDQPRDEFPYMSVFPPSLDCVIDYGSRDWPFIFYKNKLYKGSSTDFHLNIIDSNDVLRQADEEDLILGNACKRIGFIFSIGLNISDPFSACEKIKQLGNFAKVYSDITRIEGKNIIRYAKTYNNIKPHCLYEIDDKSAHVYLTTSAEKDREKVFIYLNGKIFIGSTTHAALLPTITDKVRQFSKYRFTQKGNINDSLSFGHILKGNVAVIDSATNINCDDNEIKRALLAEGIDKIYSGQLVNKFNLQNVTRLANLNLYKKEDDNMNRILMRIAAEKKDDHNTNDDLDFDDEDFDIDDINETNSTNTDNNISENIDNDQSEIEKIVSDDPYANFKDPPTQPTMRNQLIENTFKALANDGRGVLKRMEDYKFKVIQSLNIFNVDVDLKTKVEQKQKILESAIAQIYGIVFDLENYDLTPNYEGQQFASEDFPEDKNVDNDFADENNIDNEIEEDSADKGESEPLLQGGFDEFIEEGEDGEEE